MEITQESTLLHQLGLRVDTELRNRIEQAAAERDMKVNPFLVKLVKEGLDRLTPPEDYRLTQP
jgi:uncharacterized protein (DUF1778 family)